MRKTACTDNEIVLFIPKLIGFAETAAAASDTMRKRVPVYARSLHIGMFPAFPKKRGFCPVQQKFSHTPVKKPSEIRLFAIACYDEVVVPPKKHARLFPEPA